MKLLNVSILVFMFFGFGQQNASGQLTMHNFTITDTDGLSHNLYNDYLNQGKTVVIKFFFTTCPPCIAITPQWQAKYVAWGSGDNDVEFIEPSVLTSDTNAKVKTFKNNYGLTMVGVGFDGNASSIVSPFQSGTYGSWYGTPSFAVIAPDKSMQFPVFFADLDDAIAATGAMMPGAAPLVTNVNLNLQTYNVDIPDGHIKFYMKPKNSSTPKIEIVKNIQNQYSFIYPSTTFPTMAEPEIIMESPGPAYTAKVSASDLLTIQKHILGITQLTESYKLVAADVNNDTKITALDLLTLKKVILGVISQFPNGKPTYQSIPSTQSVIASPGNTVNINMSVVKVGNVN